MNYMGEHYRSLSVSILEIIHLNVLALILALPGSFVYSQFDSPYGLGEAIQTTMDGFIGIALLLALIARLKKNEILSISLRLQIPLLILVFFSRFLIFQYNPALSTFDLIMRNMFIIIPATILSILLLPMFFFALVSEHSSLELIGIATEIILLIIYFVSSMVRVKTSVETHHTTEHS